MYSCNSRRLIFALLCFIVQTTFAAGQPGSQFVWLEPWVVHPPGDYCFTHGDGAAATWAFGKESPAVRLVVASTFQPT